MNLLCFDLMINSRDSRYERGDERERERQAEGGAGDKVQTAVRHSGRSVAI